MNLKRAIVYTCALASITGLIGQANAKIPQKSAKNFYSDYYDDYDNGYYDDYDDGYYDDYDDYYGDDYYGDDYYGDYQPAKPIRLKQVINRRYTGQNLIKVRQLLGIGREYRNFKLKKVILVARTDAGRGKATLLINKMRVQREIVGTIFERVKLFPIAGEDVIGQDIRSIQIALRGNFDVKKVIAVLEPKTSHMQRTQVLQQQVERNYRGEQKLFVRNMLGMGRQMNGQKVLKVILNASSARGHGKATLLVNGMEVGMPKTLGIYGTTAEFTLPRYSQVLGQDIRTLQIRLKGNIYVTNLKVVVTKQRGSVDDDYTPGPIGQRQMSQRVNRSVYGNSSLQVSTLLNATYRQSQKTVQTVIVKANAGIRGEMKICTLGYYQTCTIGKLIRGQQQVRFELNGQHKLQDLLLETQGNMTIKTIKVLF